ncbi:MAG: ATP-dependent helicase [Lachnospiraceae bacterium]|nr:ATP-dependent helicase [Lachnospiraceae bacterium]
MKLNKEQYVAAHHVNGPMLVLAGPGSGKTHLLVERIRLMIEEKHIPPDNILVITFSKKAARQMQARFAGRVEGNIYPVTFGTFHAVFYHILQEYDPNVLRLITEEERREFIGLSVRSCALYSELFTDDDNTDTVIELIGAFKNFGKDMYEHNEYARDMTEGEREEFEKMITEYDRVCRKNNVIDFDDMILLCGKLLYKHERVLRKWQQKYRYILVDEFQDINETQYKVLRLLAGDEMNVFAVGDDDQSIYAFRGARPELMKKFLHQYKGCRQVTLTMNYRCCENVIGAADTLIRHNADRLSRPMQRHLPSMAGGLVYIVNSENTVLQAAFVCDMISDLLRQGLYRADDIAVLYRSGHCASMFIRTAKECRIPLNVTSQGEEVPLDVRIHEAYKRAHENRASRADYFLIMNNPERGLSREALCPDTGDYIGDLMSYYRDDPEKLEKVKELKRTVREYDKEAPDDIKEKKSGVSVMTAHASKGLEFGCVFVISLQEGLFPHHKGMTESGISEERRLMYVAMTRAKERLYMCTVSTEHGKRPSRFAAESVENMRYIEDTLKIIRS